MDKNFAKSAKELEYANLKEDQEKKLRDLEKQFNYEFGTDYYFMVVKRD